MKRRVRPLLVLALSGAALIAHGALPAIEGFDGLTVGQPLTTAYNGWQASASSVTAVDAPTQGGSARSVRISSGILSNNVNTAGPTGVVWTEFYVLPVRGDVPVTAATNVASHVHYFGTNGFLYVYTRSGYQCVTNDIQGKPLPVVSASTLSRISIYQNFNATTSAVLLNGTVVLQDVEFPGSSRDYRRFRIRNDSSEATVLDTFSASRVIPASADDNDDGSSDAQELETYGYVARRLTVGETTAEMYHTLSAAAAVARDRDVIIVTNVTGVLGAGEAAVFQGDVTLTGVAFINDGAITVATGSTLTLALPSIHAGTLTVSGTVAIADDTMATFADAQFGSAGTVTATGGTWTVSAAVVDLHGSFTVRGNDWNNVQAASALNMTEDFEVPATGTTLQNLWFRGWGASSAASTVVASPVAAGAHAASVVGVVSNRVNGAGVARLWTDLWLRPVLGMAPITAATNRGAVVLYISTNGMPFYFANGWHEIRTNAVGGTFSPMSAGSFARLTLFTDFDADEAAIFLNGTLLVQRVSFPLDSAAYTRLTLRNEDPNAVYLDNVRITDNPPADLTADIDGDTRADAIEIHNDGNLNAKGYPGSIVLFQ